MASDLSALSTAELEAMLAAQASGSADPRVATKPIQEWSADELKSALAGPPATRLTVRPKHVLEALPVGQREGGEPLKPSFTAAGGVTGAILGSVAGVPGAIAGGAAGTALGSGLYDIYRGARRQFVDDPTVPPSTTNLLTEPLKDAGIDAAFGGAIHGLPLVTAMGRAAGRGMLGVGDAARKVANEAEQHGVNLGIADVSQYPKLRGVLGTFTRMPLFGIPAGIAERRKLAQLDSAWQHQLDTLGPAKGAGELGEELVKQGQAKYQQVRGVISSAYENAEKVATQEGATVPANQIRKAAADAEFELLHPRPLLQSTGEPASSVAPEYLRKFLSEVQDYPAKLTAKEANWVGDQIDALMDKARKDGFQWSQADDIRRAVKSTMEGAANSTSPAAKAYVEADAQHAQLMKQFETPVGQKFGRVDKNMFKPGYEKPGGINPDEVLTAVMSTKSPQALQQLEELVGKPALGAASRRHVNNAYTEASVVDEKGKKYFDAAVFRKMLHLDDVHSQEYQALKHMYAAQGGNIDDLRKLADVSSKVYENKVPDAVTYLIRRAIFTGTTAAGIYANAFQTLGLSHAGGIGVSWFLSSPGRLKALLRLYDPKTGLQTKRQIGVQLIRAVSRTEKELGKSPEEPPELPPEGVSSMRPMPAMDELSGRMVPQAANALGAR